MQFNPEIEKAAKANRKAVRLSKSVPPAAREQLPSTAIFETETITSPDPIVMGEPPRPKLGDYGLALHRGQLTHTFQPANPVAFDIKSTVLNGLRDKQFDGSETMSPHEHLSRFAETCEFCVPPATVTESQKKLRLFPFTLTGRAKDWLLTIPNGTINNWGELELRFLAKYFPMSKFWDKRMEISIFKQGESESLYDAWERFNLLLKRCPNHELTEKQYLQIFTEGLTYNNRMFLDASAGGSFKNKTDHEVLELIETMASNEYRADAKKKERGVFGVSDQTSILANQAAMNKQLETLTKEFHSYTLANKQHVAAVRCDLCGEGHPNGDCLPEESFEEANYMGSYQRSNQYYNSGINRHPNLSYSNNNTLNPLLPNPQQQQQQRKPSALEETMINFMKMTQENFEEMKKSEEAERKNNEASRKMLETQLGQLAKQLSEQNKVGFSGNTTENPKNESCNAIELRSRKVLPPIVQKKVEEVVVEEEKNGEVEKNDEEVVEKKNEQEEVENERKRKMEEEKNEKLIDEDSILRRTKSQILKDGDKPQIIPSYVKLPYPHLAKKKKKEDGQFKKFMDIFSQLQVNIPFIEALDQMPIYAKFIKELLTGRRKPKDDENISLSENCSAILQKKLPPKLKDPGAFTIPCSIGPVNIGRALCDLGASINLMPLSMMKKLGCGEPKPTRMTLTLADRSISHPFGVLEDVLVKVNELVFPADFVILDMAEDEEMPLILGRPFLATGRALIDVAMGQLVLRFHSEQVVFNIFEEMKHRLENPSCYQMNDVGEFIEDNPVKEGIGQRKEKDQKVHPPNIEDMFSGGHPRDKEGVVFDYP